AKALCIPTPRSALRRLSEASLLVETFRGNVSGSSWGGGRQSLSPRLPFAAGASLTIVGRLLNAMVPTPVIAPHCYPAVAPAADATGTTPIRFGSDVELVQYRVTPDAIQSGGTVDVDLLWQARSTPVRNWAVSLSMLGESGDPLALARSWPQAGSA